MSDNESGIVKPAVLQERALYYLDRKLDEIEAKGKPIDQVLMAKAGVGYDQRQKATQKQTENAEKFSNELGAWRWVRDLVQNADV